MVIGFIDVLSVLIVAGCFLLLLSVMAGGIRRLRRPKAASVQVPISMPSDELEREERHRVVEERGAELIERRIELDQRRGTLGSYTDINEEFTQLEHRLRSGEISDEEFETEKIRLLTEGHG